MSFIIGIIVGVAVVVAVYFIARHVQRRRLLDSLKLTLFLIRVPKEDSITNQNKSSEEKDFKAEINKTEQLLSNLASLKKPFALEVAVPYVGEEIHFYLA